MVYRIPSVKVLEDSIRKVIREQQSIPSQRLFTELVLEDLHKKNPEYKVGEVRLRRMALHRNLAKVTISYRETKDPSHKGRCPVCCSPIEELHNFTLDEKKVELGFKCTKCPYWTGPRRRVPVRYNFTMFGAIVPPSKKKGKFAQWKFA
ncbi:MAG TPA: hypothetical protein PLC39_06575 [Methanomassiliicoccales archaeon]|nr:hypothetical protein [Methanomassiliicoccales archaeon]HPR98943.1 hypothetical protein [Methanomassiliicoccales archaeon]